MKRAHFAGLALLPAVLACETPPVTPVSPATSPVTVAPAASVAAAPVPAPPVVDRDFLRLYTESRGFSRGTPRSATLTPDGSAVVFLRSGPRDTRQSLYEMDVATGAVHLVVPGVARHRARAPDGRGARAPRAHAHHGERSHRIRAEQGRQDPRRDPVGEAVRGRSRERQRRAPSTSAKGAVIDPHLSPDGKLVAYVQDDDVHVASVDGRGKPRALTRGGTDGQAPRPRRLRRVRGARSLPGLLVVARLDSRSSTRSRTGPALEHFTIADPGHPEKPADRVAYPRAGTANAVLRFGIVEVAAPGATTWIDWDRRESAVRVARDVGRRRAAVWSSSIACRRTRRCSSSTRRRARPARRCASTTTPG